MYYFVIYLLLFSWINIIHACDIYISSIEGSDTSGDGSINNPYASWDVVRSSDISGQTVCFQKGNTFYGEIVLSGSKHNNVTVTSYGDATENPLIKGSMVLENWNTINLNGNTIYYTEVPAQTDLPGDTGDIHHLFVNEEIMTIARYPNVDSPAEENWLIIDEGASGANWIKDVELGNYGKADDYWNGATLRRRSYSWTLEICPIDDYVSAEGQVIASCISGQKAGWGYFIDDKLEELDYPGEWFYDKTNNHVYLYPPNGINPNTALIEASVYNEGVYAGSEVEGVIVENLNIKQYNTNCITVSRPVSVTIQNNEASHCATGLYFYKHPDYSPLGYAKFKNNYVHDTYNTGFSVTSNFSLNFDNSAVEDNVFINIGMYPGYGIRYGTGTTVYNGTGIKIYAGDGLQIKRNKLINIGWSGMYIQGTGGHTIEQNYIQKALSIANDGGAISWQDADNLQIINNILIESVGNIGASNGCSSKYTYPCYDDDPASPNDAYMGDGKHGSYGMGIGCDGNTENNLIEGNIVANNNDMAIRLNSHHNSLVQNNITFNNGRPVTLHDFQSYTSENNTVRNNLLFFSATDQHGLQMNSDTVHGIFEQNQYCNLYNLYATKKDNKNYTIDSWQNSHDNASGNTLCPLIQTDGISYTKYTEYQTTATDSELIINTGFDIDGSNWSSSISQYESDDSVSGMEGGSLKINAPDATTTRITLSANTFKLEQGKWYRVRFSIKGQGDGLVHIRVNDTSRDVSLYPYSSSAILAERFFGINTQKQDYEFVFQSALTSYIDKTKLFFFTYYYSDTDTAPSYFLDNVSLVEISPPSKRNKDKLIFDPADAANASADSILLINDSWTETRSYNLPTGAYMDLDKNSVDFIQLAPFEAKILINNLTVVVDSDGDGISDNMDPNANISSDFDGDGDNDTDDLNVIYANYGINTSSLSGSEQNADMDGDGVIDYDDIWLWYAEYLAQQ